MDHAVTALTRTYLETHTPSKQNITITRAHVAPTADYESVTAEQWQRNYGCKLTKANVFRLYITNRLLPGDRNYVARVIGGAIVQSVTEGEDATFGRVRRTKDAIVGYFQRGLDVYEREAARLGIKPNITHQTYAAPGLASAALVLVPENSDQVITEMAVMLGLHVVGVGVARSTTWMYNKARNAGVVAHGVPRVGGGKTMVKPLSFQDALNHSGSGPTTRVISVNPNSKSFKALDNYTPAKGIEFVYDPERKIFAVGKVKNFDSQYGLSSLSFHQRLARSINANEKTVLGGTFSRTKNGTIKLTEHSGHYGTRWNSNQVAREEMLDLLSKNLKSEIDYMPWDQHSNTGFKYGQ